MALAATALPSAAADLGARPITKAPIAAPIAAYNWSGCYIGANGGGKWGRYSGDVATAGVVGFAFPGALPGVVTANNDDFSSGGMGGGQIGCQWQSGAFVWGLEGDIDATSVRQTFVAPVGVGGLIAPGDAVEFRNRWQASIRGRIGYAWDRFMIYATGGVAFADVRATLAPVGIGFVTFEDSQTLTGGTVGGGLEYGITDNLSLGVEYRFSKFGHENFAFATTPILGVPVTANSDLETHEVTARLNWRFNWFGAGPVAGRY
jgi:outer membrane immunogenic protein